MTCSFCKRRKDTVEHEGGILLHRDGHPGVICTDCVAEVKAKLERGDTVPTIQDKILEAQQSSDTDGLISLLKRKASLEGRSLRCQEKTTS